MDALEQAEEAIDWTRAEAAAAALVRIEPDDPELVTRLDIVRARRATHDELEAVAELLNAGAWRTSQGRLQVLLSLPLHDEDRAQVNALLVRIGETHPASLPTRLPAP